MFKNTYKDKRVFVTGHTGFKGSWLTAWLNNLGAEVMGYSLEPETNPSHFELLNQNINSVIGDIRNHEKLKKTIHVFKPEIVFHLAAQPLVRRSYNQPVETFDTNVMGTLHLLEACRSSESVKAIIIITSDKCYENKEWVYGYRENDPMGGYDPYSSSKGCAEIMTSSYRQSYFNLENYNKDHQVLLATARAGNVIGGGDWAEDRLIPDIMKSVALGKEVIIRNPVATRPWQHVLEPLSGYLKLGQELLNGNKSAAEGWNFGPGDEGNLSVLHVVETAQKIWEKVTFSVQQEKNAPHEAKLLKLDCSKASMYLKWKSIWNAKQAISKSIEWYQNYYEINNIITDDQIKNYQNDSIYQGINWSKE